MAKTHVQHSATAAAIKVDRIVAWLEERPRAKTRTARFAALAPACALPAGTPPEKTPADLPGPGTASKSTHENFFLLQKYFLECIGGQSLSIDLCHRHALPSDLPSKNKHLAHDLLDLPY